MEEVWRNKEFGIGDGRLLFSMKIGEEAVVGRGEEK